MKIGRKSIGAGLAALLLAGMLGLGSAPAQASDRHDGWRSRGDWSRHHTVRPHSQFRHNGWWRGNQVRRPSIQSRRPHNRHWRPSYNHWRPDARYWRPSRGWYGNSWYRHR